MHSKTSRFSLDSVDERTVKPIVKLLLVVGALFLLWGLVSNLPGIDAFVPATTVTYAALLGALMTLAIVAVLGYLAFKIEPVVELIVSGPPELVADLASMIKYLLLFVAAVTAYRGLARLVVPTLDLVALAWTYDLLFLVLAAIPIVAVAVLMLRNLDDVASIVSGRLTTPDDDDHAGETPSRRNG